MKQILPYHRFTQIFFALLFFVSLNATAQTPVIDSVFPTKVTMNTRITITGTNFGTTPTISFGAGLPITATGNYVSRSNTKIVFKVTGTVNGAIKVNKSGTSSDPYHTATTYVAPVARTATNNVHIDEIITDYNGFWQSASASSVAVNQPNTRHNLLAFRFKGTRYSTGANDAVLDERGVSYVPQGYRAYSTRGVNGTTHPNLFLAMPDLEDGTVHNASANYLSPNIQGMTIYDVLIDGLNGLDIGTGVTNFNTQASISFFSDNAQSGGGAFYDDDVPEVLITQIADPGSTDYFHFSDVNGNIVGKPISLNMAGITAVGRYRLDLFTFPNNANFNTATPNGNRPVDNRTREIRLVGLKFSDFGIDDTNIHQINSFDMLAGGTADVAFLAYNTQSFIIKSPVITSTPNSVKICKLPYPSSVTFSVGAAIQGGGGGTLNYQWKKNNFNIPGATGPTLTIPGPITAAELATYRVEVSNNYGAIVASSAVLKEGGDIVVWDGEWSPTPPHSGASIIFAADYNTTQLGAGDRRLDGCDCTIQNDVTVTIDSGDKFILQNNIKIEDARAPWVEVIPAHYNEFGDYVPEETISHPAQAAGKMLVKNNGSFIQVSETAENSGRMEVERMARNLHQWDYVYWSAPVGGFEVTNLAPYSTPIYSWNPTAVNANGSYGNWISASGPMAPGKGYIARVNSSANHTVRFSGSIHNGPYEINLTGATNADPDTNYWNLVGNPYPSSIDALDFLASNLDIEGNIRIWSHNAPIGEYNPEDSPYYQNFPRNYGDQYITYNAMGSVPAGFNGKIGSGQGFFVQGKSTTGKVTFKNLFRYKETVPVYNNNQFYRQVELSENGNSNYDKSVIWLSLLNPSEVSANMAVGYAEGATMGEDRLFDAIVEQEPFSIYSMIGDKGAIIQGRPAPFNNSDVVPVGVSVETAGVYKIGIDRVSGIFDNDFQNIYLEDLYLNVIHDLRATPYAFDALPGNYPDRFVLRYEQQALGNNDIVNAQTLAFIKNNKLEIQSAHDIASVEVYDLSGKRIHQYQVANGATQFTGDFNYANGFYMVTINLKNNTQVTKKLAH